jgi:hypothetical protein
MTRLQKDQAIPAIIELDIDKLEEKPWRKPGADISDYFNYGFSEETWRLYCRKQIQMRQEQTMQTKIKVFQSGNDSEIPQAVRMAMQNNSNSSGMYCLRHMSYSIG